jgi:hypothetical protein
VRVGSAFVVLGLAACASHRPELAFQPGALRVFAFLAAKYDRDGDGRIERREYPRSARAFAHLDADGNGAVERDDFADLWDGVPRQDGFEYGEGGPQLGDPAPEFELTSTRGERIALRSFRGLRPVALVFGSFT